MLQFVCDVVKDAYGQRGIRAPVYSHWIGLDQSGRLTGDVSNGRGTRQPLARQSLLTGDGRRLEQGAPRRVGHDVLSQHLAVRRLHQHLHRRHRLEVQLRTRRTHCLRVCSIVDLQFTLSISASSRGAEWACAI